MLVNQPTKTPQGSFFTFCSREAKFFTRSDVSVLWSVCVWEKVLCYDWFAHPTGLSSPLLPGGQRYRICMNYEWHAVDFVGGRILPQFYCPKCLGVKSTSL